MSVEHLEDRRPLAGDAPMFYFDFTGSAAEYSFGQIPWWSISPKDEGDSIQVDTGAMPFVSGPVGTSQLMFSARQNSVARTATLTMSLHHSAIMDDPENGFHSLWSQISVAVTIYARAAHGIQTTTSGDFVSNREAEGRLGGGGGNGYYFSGYPVAFNVAASNAPRGHFETKLPGIGITYNPPSKEIDGVMYVVAGYFSVSSVITLGDSNEIGAAKGTYTRSLEAIDLVLELSVADREPLVDFRAPTSIGLGKSFELNAIGTRDPDQATGDGNGIVAHEWYAQRVDQPGALEFLGNGVTLEYVYSDSSVLDELGQYAITLKVTDDEGTVASLTKPLTITMDFRNVIFHGWSPLESALSGTHISFAEYAGRLNAALRTPELVPKDSTFASFAFDWDSYTGFTRALVSRVAAEAMLVAGIPLNGTPFTAATMLILRQILLWDYRQHHALASQQAEIAAHNAARFIAKSPGIIPDDPLRTPALHLIGHSRGGYVASRVSQILESSYGISTSYVSVLDGYGDDWPGFAASFADGDIPSTATGLYGNNFRVEQNLLEIITDPLAEAVSKSIQEAARRSLNPLLSSSGSAMSGIISTLPELVVDAFRRWMESLEWRAPERGGIFGNNEVVPGVPATGRSNHINIHQLYFGVPAAGDREAVPPNMELLLKSPVGNPKSVVPGSSGASGEASFYEPLDGSIDFLSPRFFTELYQTREAAAKHLGVLDGENSWIDVYLHLLAEPGFLEQQFFGSESARVVQVLEGRHGIELSSNNNLRTSVSVPSSGGEIEISHVVENLEFGQSAELQIILDGTLVGSLPIVENGLMEHSLPYSNARQSTVSIELALTRPSTNRFSAKVSVAGVKIMGPDVKGDFYASPAFTIVGKGEEIALHLDGLTSNPDNVISNIAFFLEKNNQIGLQDEMPGDVLLGNADRLDEAWYLEISERDLGAGRNTLYAKVTLDSGRELVQALTLDNLVLRSDMTFHSNPYDVNRDGSVAPLDALLVLNYLARSARQENLAIDNILPDVNGDGLVEPLDALLVLNEFAQRGRVRFEGEHVTPVGGSIPLFNFSDDSQNSDLLLPLDNSTHRKRLDFNDVFAKTMESSYDHEGGSDLYRLKLLEKNSTERQLYPRRNRPKIDSDVVFANWDDDTWGVFVELDSAVDALST